MKNISGILNTPLVATLIIVLIVLLVLAAFAAWGAYRDRPNELQSPKPIPEPSKKEEARPVPVPPLKTMTAEPVYPCKGEEPCAKERLEIERLKANFAEARQQAETAKREVHDLTGRLANANKALGEKPKETAPEKKRVSVKNVMGLLAGLGDVNSKAAADIRNETKKDQPEFDRVKPRLETFSIHLAQRGYEKPTAEQLFQLLIEAQKK